MEYFARHLMPEAANDKRVKPRLGAMKISFFQRIPVSKTPDIPSYGIKVENIVIIRHATD